MPRGRLPCTMKVDEIFAGARQLLVTGTGMAVPTSTATTNVPSPIASSQWRIESAELPDTALGSKETLLLPSDGSVVPSSGTRVGRAHVASLDSPATSDT